MLELVEGMPAALERAFELRSRVCDNCRAHCPVCRRIGCACVAEISAEAIPGKPW